MCNVQQQFQGLRIKNKLTDLQLALQVCHIRHGNELCHDVDVLLSQSSREDYIRRRANELIGNTHKMDGITHRDMALP